MINFSNKIVTVFVGYVESSNGKFRPVLALNNYEDEGILYCYRITSRYNSKSKNIQNQYFEIIYWEEAGLNKKSWIDTGEIIDIDTKLIKRPKEIGILSDVDIRRLRRFLRRRISK